MINKILHSISSITLFLFLSGFIAGCGYTTKSVLPRKAQSIHVENFKNKIDITDEISDRRVYILYRPGIELDVTREVIDKFIIDGNIAVRDSGNADLILTGELMDFRKEALRYDANDNAVEFRIKIVVNMRLEDAGTQEALWEENGFIGESTYRTGGEFASSENSALLEAIRDLARRIVERTVEGW